MTGYGVHPGEMHAHSQHLHKAGDRIAGAGGVAGETTSHTEMYGVIGQFLVPAVLAVEGAGLAAIKGAEASTRAIGGGITGMAKAYVENEKAIKEILEAIYGDQDGGEQ